MEVNLEIGKYSDLQDLGGFEKTKFSSIDEAISTLEFLKLGYNSFGKDRTSLMVRLEEGSKPFLLDYNSILPIKEIREDLERKYGKLEHKEDEIEFKVTEKKEKTSLNSNFTFPSDSSVQYAKTTTGEKLPFKLFSTDDIGRRTNLLQQSGNPEKNTDFALIERRFTENNTLDFSGKEKIESINDLAFLFSSLEDEAIEHAFLVYHFEDKGYFVQHISSGNFNSALIEPKSLIGNILEAQPKSITLVHNHPSGVLKASPSDGRVIENLKTALKSTDVIVNNGIIINLRSGKYLEFDEKLWQNEHQKNGVITNSNKIQPYSFSKQILVENFQPIQLKSNKDVAAYLTSQKFGISDKTELLVLNAKLNIVGKFLMPNSNREHFMIEKISKYGGFNCILYGNNITPEEIKFYNSKLEKLDISIIDAFLFKSKNGEKIWESIIDYSSSHNYKPLYVEENHLNNNMENELTWFDKMITPKTQGYKDFVNKMENTPSEQWFQDGEREFSDKEKKYMQIYESKLPKIELKYEIITNRENTHDILGLEKLIEVVDFFTHVDFQKGESFEFKDFSNNTQRTISNETNKHSFLADLWAKELQKKQI